MQLPKWITNIAIVTLIFTIGGYVARLEYGMKDLTKRMGDIEKKTVAVETAISIHHGQDWSAKVENRTLKKVDDLETKIGTISEDFNSNVDNLKNLQARVTAIHMWTKQGDDLIRKSRLDQFRALAAYTTRKTKDKTLILINRAHRKGYNFKSGDKVMLTNPLPPSPQVETMVGGFIDDPDSAEILVQINEQLIEDLGLNQQKGHFELFVQGRPEALRWKTLDDCYDIAKNQL